MSRFAIPNPASFNEQQQSIEPRAIEQMFRAFPQLEYKDDTGTLLGPYPSLYYTPDLVKPFFELANAVVHQTRFTVREREIAVLAVLATINAPYPLYAHSQIGLTCGLSRHQIQDAINGRCPMGLGPEEIAVYELSIALAKAKGPLSHQIFERAQQALGQSRIAGIAHLVASYAYVSLLSNIGDCRVPEPSKDVFLAVKDSTPAYFDDTAETQ